MPYIYSNPERESDPHSLPDCEVFYQTTHAAMLRIHGPQTMGNCLVNDADPALEGFYFAFGSPGCLWDSDPIGPFDTEAEAISDARSAYDLED